MSRASRKRVRRDAAAYARRVLRELLRSRSAGFCDRLLGVTILTAWWQVKQQSDPENVFRHAQSVPLTPPVA